MMGEQHQRDLQDQDQYFHQNCFKNLENVHNKKVLTIKHNGEFITLQLSSKARYLGTR